MKRLLAILVLAFLTVQLHAQPVAVSNTFVTVPTPVVAAPVAAGQLVVMNPDGSLTVSQDALSFIPVKYRGLVVLVLAMGTALLPVVGRMVHAYNAGGSTGQAIASAFLGKNVGVGNEIAQLKARTGLPPTPAPPAPSVPAPAPVEPLPVLTQLPPPAAPPVGSLVGVIASPTNPPKT